MTDPVVERAYARLRSETSGDLRFGEHVRPLRYVIAPATGRLVAPVMFAMLDAFDTVLIVPRDAEDDVLEVQVTLDPLDEHGDDGGLTDRWRIYHGDPQDTRWAFLDVDAARLEGMIIDGEAMMRPNPLAEHESGWCRAVNADRTDDLRALTLARASIEIEQPRLVGVDPLGLDVRGAFEVTRVPFEAPLEDPEALWRRLDEMLRAAHAPEAG